MRSQRDRMPIVKVRGAAFIRASAMAVFLVLAVIAPLYAQADGAAIDSTPKSEQVRQALEKVKADPNVTAERTIRTLKWRDSAQPQPRSRGGWFPQFIAWLAQSSRALMWVAAIIVAVILAVYLFGALKRREADTYETSILLPSHVRELDIRPSSLPSDIGGAARSLWIRGEQRAALALLYRGMLSRLVHVHRVPITDSSTEGDCLRLAIGALSAPSGAYVSGLVGVWQRHVYGHHAPDDDRVQALCADFDVSLARPRAQALMADGDGVAMAGGAA